MSYSHIALLRGINVGGKNKLPMKDLAAIFADCDCHNVKTYIQSGNVLFNASESVAKSIPAKVSKAIEKRFGLKVPVIIRTTGQWKKLAARHPYAEESDEDSRLYVVFLADLPKPVDAKSLDPNRSTPDEFTVRGQEIYLRLATGAAKTKLTNAWFDSKLATVSTIRNWRTVRTLLDLASSD